MKHQRDMEGAFPVSAMKGLTPLEALSVRCLRLWHDPAHGPAAMGTMLARRLGPERGTACHRALADVMGMIARHGRRRLARHGAECGCVGVDEAIFAHFIATAATGDREDAMLVASLLVDSAVLLPLTDSARQAGLCLHRAALRPTGAMPEPMSATRH
ncbi:hypothetical protein [Roseovarius sp. SYSU LYC5161]|uniref:hypothetical protein n=1 Tax=Roseovarius halophilus (ex Wu et al. 2025) TaxID=3376060 RepID=UPI00399949E0